MSYAMDAQTQHLSTIIEKFISNGVNNVKVQDRYILPPHDRPQMTEIVNHGVPKNVMKSMMGIAKEFYEMAVEDPACLYSEDVNQPVRFSTGFNFRRDKVLHWIDYFTDPCHPLEEVIGYWPEKPAALERDSDYFKTILGKHSQRMSINCYPSCPNPDLTLGLPNHSDRSAVTVLVQGDVSGLQLIKNGRWVSVEPINNTFVVNLGD
eukprot:PITA_30590